MYFNSSLSLQERNKGQAKPSTNLSYSHYKQQTPSLINGRFWQSSHTKNFYQRELPHGRIYVNSGTKPSKAMINTPSASLEDCHTNVLALVSIFQKFLLILLTFQTELSGLKWKRLTTPDNYVYGTDLDQDPILSAYSRCVRENVLCTWRRRQRQQLETTSVAIENVSLRLDTPKELWIFWYSNDEPELIKILMKDNGLICEFV